jgi:UDP-N-acetyl-2-amino-2-deoxyglucuronate dehydrogenase
MMKDKIRFAVVGCGHIGKRHMEMIKRMPETELVAACDLLPYDKIGISNELPLYTSIKEMLANTADIDVVSIATPNGFHAQHALEALEANKHVVIEKPMALTKADCEKVIYKALQMHKQVFCIMQNRYSPPSVWFKNLIISGVLGKIYMVNIDCFWNRDDRYYKKGGWKGTADLDGGTLFTQFSHYIDIMYWLFGDIYDIQAKFFDFNHQQSTAFEDSGTIDFNFYNGGVGIFNYSTSVWNKNLESTLTVIAENGTVKIGGQYMNEILHCHIKDYTMPVLEAGNPANDYGEYKGSAANHNYIFENVVDVLKGRASITTNALEGLKVVEIIENIYKLKGK